MITDERIVSFINSMNVENKGIEGIIEKEAIEAGVPIIRKETKEFIRTMIRIKKPVNILEVGTAVGFSAIYMSRYIPDSGHITTIENWKPRIEQAHINFERAKVDDRITLIEGDAADVLAEEGTILLIVFVANFGHEMVHDGVLFTEVYSFHGCRNFPQM